MAQSTQHTQRQSPRKRRLSIAVMLTALGTVACPLVFADTPADSKVIARCAPESTRRYCDNGDGTVRDARTGLHWLKDAACADLGETGDGKGTFAEANAAAASLRSGQCGLSDGSKPGDWRLPNRDEWLAMLNPALKNPAIANAAGTGKWQPGDAFINVQSGGYWSATTDSEASDFAWGAGLFAGVVASARKGTEGFIWPVRKP
ncbi:Lcl C-terminal domain-containing protein [Methylomagnum sp.]